MITNSSQVLPGDLDNTPLYYQLERALRAKIEKGEWKPGEAIPREIEICDIYRVSRTTARQALANLVHQGLLVRKPGKGTFVREQKTSYTMKAFADRFDAVDAGGKWAGPRIIRCEVRPADEHVADVLRIPAKSPILVVDRLEFIGDTIGAASHICLPRELVPSLQEEDFQATLPSDIYLRMGFRLTHGVTTLEARVATSDEAALLRVPGRPVVVLTSRVTYMQGDVPLEYSTAVLRADMYTLRVETISTGQT